MLDCRNSSLRYFSYERTIFSLRIFVSRATLDILPTGRNLMKRGLGESTFYENYAVEDDRQALFDYKPSTEAWLRILRDRNRFRSQPWAWKTLFILFQLSLVRKTLLFLPLQPGASSMPKISLSKKVYAPQRALLS